MKFLLDTHVLLWLTINDRRITPELRSLVEDPENEFAYSAASLWELAIKHAQGKSIVPKTPRELRSAWERAGFVELSVTGEHTVQIDLLPALHKDPFDRILLAQANVESMVLLTADRVLAEYPGPIQRV